MSLLQILGSIIISIFVISFISHLVVTNREKKRWSGVVNAWHKTSFAPSELHSDIDAYQDYYKRVHPAPFHSLTQEEFDRTFLDLKQRITRDTTRQEFFCLLADTVSQFNDEHTQVGMPSIELNQLLGEKGKVFPAKVTFLGERCFINKQEGKFDALPAGAEILSINAVPAVDIIRRLSRLFWGTSDRQRAYYAQKHFPEALYLAYSFEESFDVVVKLPDGRQQERRIRGVEYQVVSMPPFAYKVMDGFLLFKYRKFVDHEGNFKNFLREMFAEMQQKSLDKLVIDLRENQGGTSSLGDTLLRYLTNQTFSQFDLVEIRSSPEVKRFFLSFLPASMHWFFPLPNLHPLMRDLWRTRTGNLSSVYFKPVAPAPDSPVFEGDVYVLIGPGTMSSASLLAATIKKYKLGRLAGEDTGGYPTHYGNMLDFHLPHTGIRVMIPSSINHGNGTGPVVPDIRVEQDLSDLITGKDTLLEAVKQTALQVVK